MLPVKVVVAKGGRGEGGAEGAKWRWRWRVALEK